MAFLPTVGSIVYIPDSNAPHVQIPPVALNLGRVLCIADAAKRIGVSERSIRRALAARRLAHFRIDGRVYINESELNSYHLFRLHGDSWRRR